MKTTDILRSQHNKIIMDIEEIKPLLKEKEFQKDIIINSNLILTLVGKISAQFSIEQTTFYSKALLHKDDNIRITAERFINEIIKAKQKFDDYRIRWKNINSIKENIAKFLDEGKSLASSLPKLMQKEERELFLLIDSSQYKQF